MSMSMESVRFNRICDPVYFNLHHLITSQLLHKIVHPFKKQTLYKEKKIVTYRLNWPRADLVKINVDNVLVESGMVVKVLINLMVVAIIIVDKSVVD